MKPFAFMVLVALAGCSGDDMPGDDAGGASDSALPRDSAVDAAVEDSSVTTDGSTTADGSTTPDAGPADGASCFDFGTSCGAVADPVCCEGTCGPVLRTCCSEPGGRCEMGTTLVNDGCCAGSSCNADTGLCEVRACFPSYVPGSGGPSCMAPGETAPCCDAGYVCTEDPISDPWCCAPAETIIDAARMAECCSGSVEVLSGDRVRCLAGT